MADPRYAVGDAVMGGYNGMVNIPSLALELPGRSPTMLGPREYFYATGGLLLAVIILLRLLVLSHFGRVLVAIRENERRTELLGYDVRWRKLVAFALSGAVAGLAGGLFAGWGNFVNPEVFSLPQSALVVIWVLVGGRGTLYGAVAGAVVVQFLTNTLGEAGATYTTVTLGAVLVAIVLLFRRGLAPSALAALLYLWGRAKVGRAGAPGR
jgi:branched-chain amino acid transport system permease protein